MPYSQQYFVVGLYNSAGLGLLVTITIGVRRFSVVVVVGLVLPSSCKVSSQHQHHVAINFF